MEHDRQRVVREEIIYDRYDNVVLYYNLDKLNTNANPFNLFRDNVPHEQTVVEVRIRLLTDTEWNEYKTTGKVNGETVWEGFPD